MKFKDKLEHMMTVRAKENFPTIVRMELVGSGAYRFALISVYDDYVDVNMGHNKIRSIPFWSIESVELLEAGAPLVLP